jgi:two-component system sensor histidine kinase DegS
MGLSKAVEKWLREETAQKHGLNVCFSDDGLEKPLNEEVKAILFRSVREALNNIVKHAQATNVTVRIQQDNSDIVVSIADDGIGFDPQAFLTKGNGFGLLSIRESLERLGGRLEIRTKEDPGSLVLLRLPLMLRT